MSVTTRTVILDSLAMHGQSFKVLIAITSINNNVYQKYRTVNALALFTVLLHDAFYHQALSFIDIGLDRD